MNFVCWQAGLTCLSLLGMKALRLRLATCSSPSAWLPAKGLLGRAPAWGVLWALRCTPSLSAPLLFHPSSSTSLPCDCRQMLQLMCLHMRLSATPTTMVADPYNPMQILRLPLGHGCPASGALLLQTCSSWTLHTQFGKLCRQTLTGLT